LSFSALGIDPPLVAEKFVMKSHGMQINPPDRPNAGTVALPEIRSIRDGAEETCPHKAGTP
jgi:hypothetical protein